MIYEYSCGSSGSDAVNHNSSSCELRSKQMFVKDKRQRDHAKIIRIVARIAPKSLQSQPSCSPKAKKLTNHFSGFSNPWMKWGKQFQPTHTTILLEATIKKKSWKAEQLKTWNAAVAATETTSQCQSGGSSIQIHPSGKLENLNLCSLHIWPTLFKRISDALEKIWFYCLSISPNRNGLKH